MRRKMNRFMRTINSKSKKYRAVVVYEIKHQGKNLYHLHIHVAYERSPHLNTVIRLWNKIMGTPTRVDVRYNRSKMAMIRYFARRTALAGVGMPIDDYLACIHGKQLTNCFGIDLKDMMRLNRVDSNLVGTRNYSYKKKILYIIFLGTMPKLKTDTVPPPLSEWGYS